MSANSLNSANRSLLQKASSELVRLGDNRGLITLVEQWCSIESVPTSVLISEIKALLDYKLMDRAWVRLREVSERQPEDLEVICLTCEMFIGRGWPARAEKLLKPLVSVGGYPDVVDDLFLRSQRAAISPPMNAREIERRGSPAERLALAECFVATGSHLRARSVLERIRHDGVGEIERADDLLWGLDAGYDNYSKPLMERARDITGDEVLEGAGAINLDNLHRDRTAEVTMAGGGETLPESVDPSFPSLFRSVDTDDDEEGVAEATKVTSLSSLMSEDAPETTEHTESEGLAAAWEDTFDDTRVMVVVNQSSGDGGKSNDEAEALNLSADELDDFDLDDSGLGVAGLLEVEDADLIVLTNDDVSTVNDDKYPKDVVHSPMIEVESDEPEVQSQPVSDTSPSYPSKPETTPSAPRPLKNKEPRDTRGPATTKPRMRQLNPAPQNSLAFRKMLQITFAMAIVCLIFVAYATSKKHHAQAEAVVSEIVVALSGTDTAWRGTSAAFERRVSSGFDPTLRNELGIVLLDMLRWSESGNIETSRELIEANLLSLKEDLFGAPEYSLALAEFSLITGDYQELNILLDELDYTGWAEVQHLRSASMLHVNNLDAAKSFASGALALRPNSVRYLSALGRVCSLDGDTSCVGSVADTLARVAPESTYATLMSIAGSASPLADPRLDEVLRQSTPRIASQSLLWFAQLSGNIDMVAQAVDRALGLDPYNSEARLLKGVRRLGQGEVSAAEMDFTVCMNMRPASFECQLGLALAQFERDHVDEAASWITREDGSSVSFRLNPVLFGWLQFEQGAAISSIEELGIYRPYLRAMSDRDGEAMLMAADELLRRGGAINQFIGARGIARAARFGVEQSGVADRAYALAPLDPVVLTDLAWLWDSVGYERRSQHMFQVAFDRGGESAYTLVERGRFFLDLGDNFNTTRAAWLHYRDLNPTGPRSEARLSSLERLR